MASGHVNRTQRPNTWLHRPSLRREDSPCQLGAVHTWPITTCCAAVADGHFRGKADSGRSSASLSNNAIKSWNAGDLDGYLNMYDGSVLLHGYSPEPLDKAGVVARYKGAWANLSMPGEKGPFLTIEDAFEAEDRVVSRFTMSGVQSGSFMRSGQSRLW
jgi:hypothetical protein